MRMKADSEVGNPHEAMGRFKALLGNLMKVPKSEVLESKRKPKASPKRKRKS
jgi:hypothetical protein